MRFIAYLLDGRAISPRPAAQFQSISLFRNILLGLPRILHMTRHPFYSILRIVLHMTWRISSCNLYAAGMRFLPIWGAPYQQNGRF